MGGATAPPDEVFGPAGAVPAHPEECFGLGLAVRLRPGGELGLKGPGYRGLVCVCPSASCLLRLHRPQPLWVGPWNVDPVGVFGRGKGVSALKGSARRPTGGGGRGGVAGGCGGGHFPVMLLLLMAPQLINFLVSIPQLFKLRPCPRHRLPTYDEQTGLLRCSYVNDRATIVQDDSMNLTLINVVLRIKPMTEPALAASLLLIQALCCALALFLRFGWAGGIY